MADEPERISFTVETFIIEPEMVVITAKEQEAIKKVAKKIQADIDALAFSALLGINFLDYPNKAKGK